MWLDEGNGRSLEEIRNLNKHPWMGNLLLEGGSEGYQLLPNGYTRLSKSKICSPMDPSPIDASSERDTGHVCLDCGLFEYTGKPRSPILSMGKSFRVSCHITRLVKVKRVSYR